MSLFLANKIGYNISMRKLFLFLAITLLLPSTQAVANPFSLDTENNGSISLINKIATQEPIYIFAFDWNKEGNLEHDPRFFKETQLAFTAWFENVLSRLKPDSPQEEEIKELLSAIRFGADKENFRYDRTREDISFAFGDRKSITQRCGGAACAKGNRIYIFYPENDSFKSTFIHEIGHVLSLEDLYSTEHPASAGVYGSGIQSSIMNNAQNLTCDDADAIVNALYIAQKRLGIYPDKDFTFTSFCSNSRTFKNAQMRNRQTTQIDYRGKRTIFTYCPDGPVHTYTQINPHNPQELFSHQVVTACDNPSAPAFSSTPSYTMEDFLAHRPYPVSHDNPLTVDLPSYKNPLKVSFTQSKKAPQEVRLYDSKDNTVFLFARLEDEYNFVWDEPLGRGGTVIINTGKGFESRRSASVYIYNRNNPKEYYILSRPHREAEACSVKDEEVCQKMKTRTMEELDFYTEKYHMLPPAGGWVFGVPKDNIKIAQKWENFLLDNYPSLYSAEKAQKAAEQLKQVKLEIVPLLKN